MLMAPGTCPAANSCGVRTSTTLAPAATSALAVAPLTTPGLASTTAASAAATPGESTTTPIPTINATTKLFISFSFPCRCPGDLSANPAPGTGGSPGPRRGFAPGADGQAGLYFLPGNGPPWIDASRISMGCAA